jgi:hypothetical protein
VINVYRNANGTGEILSGQTLLDIDELDAIYIRGVAEGSTDLVLRLDEPLDGRPLSDLVVVNVWE